MEYGNFFPGGVFLGDVVFKGWGGGPMHPKYIPRSVYVSHIGSHLCLVGYCVTRMNELGTMELLPCGRERSARISMWLLRGGHSGATW